MKEQKKENKDLLNIEVDQLTHEQLIALIARLSSAYQLLENLQKKENESFHEKIAELRKELAEWKDKHNRKHLRDIWIACQKTVSWFRSKAGEILQMGIAYINSWAMMTPAYIQRPIATVYTQACGFVEQTYVSSCGFIQNIIQYTQSSTPRP